MARSATRRSKPLTRLVVVHVLSSAGEAFFTISLAGSLFFSVSVDASRPLILAYLALSMAPFAVVAPLIGPAIDRVPGGHRVVIASTLVGRAAVALLLAVHLEHLAFYPEAFAMLVLGKTYSISRSAIVPRLHEDPAGLVGANALVSRFGTFGGIAGGVVATGLLTALDASAVLLAGSAVFVVGAVTSRMLPRIRPGVVIPTLQRAELRSPLVRASAGAMGFVRLAVGFLTFHLGFALKQSGDPLWVFGALLGAGAVGAVLGSYAAPLLRRRFGEDRILTAGLVLPALAAAVAALRFHRASAIVLAAAIGLAAGMARHAFDSIVQREAPDVERGRAFSRFETRFQVAWVIGALIPVASRPPDWAGLLALTVILGYAVAAYVEELRALAAVTGRAGVPAAMLEMARELLSSGAIRHAIVQAAMAASVAVEISGSQSPPETTLLDEMRHRAIHSDAKVERPAAERAIALASQVMVEVTRQTGSDQSSS